jgi:hypothetical protein
MAVMLPPPPANPVPARHTNNLAVISLVVAILSFVAHIVPFVGGAAMAIVAVITGHMARKQISQTGETGHGLATAGMIIGYIHLAILAIVLVIGIIVVILLLVFGIAFFHGLPTGPTPTPFPLNS